MFARILFVDVIASCALAGEARAAIQREVWAQRFERSFARQRYRLGVGQLKAIGVGALDLPDDNHAVDLLVERLAIAAAIGAQVEPAFILVVRYAKAHDCTANRVL